MVLRDAWIDRTMSEGERGFERFETVASLLLEQPSRVDSKNNSNADDARTSRAVLGTLSDWERRLGVLVTAAKKKTSDTEEAVAQDAVSFVLSDHELAPNGQDPNAYYGRILKEMTRYSRGVVGKAQPGPGPFIKYEAFVSVAAQKIHAIVDGLVTNSHLVNENVPTDPLPDISALLVLVLKVTSASTRAATILHIVEGAVLASPHSLDAVARPSKSPTSPSSFFSALFPKTSNASSKTKES